MLKLSLQYLAYGILSNAAMALYYRAPREALQDELFNLHRWALKKAHHVRMAKEALEREQEESKP